VLGRFFQCDPDLRLTDTAVYLDPSESREIGVITHGHSDHIGRHQHFVATPATASFLRLRQGYDLRGTELPYRQPHQIGMHTFEFFPAGHILGSAMVKVTNRVGERLLYTGDFRLRPSMTAETPEVPEADAVIMESTYGSPQWQFPTREALCQTLHALIRAVHGRQAIPVVLAYSLGKAQEVCVMLNRGSFNTVLHPVVARCAALYKRHGVDIGPYEVWGDEPDLFGELFTRDIRGKVLIVPPHLKHELKRLPPTETIAATGWALHRPYRGATHGLPLSDHADFDELIEFAGRTKAKVIYVTHGSRRFARELKVRGFRAQFLNRKPQMRLF